MSKDFMKDLQVILTEFRKYQLDNNEPYDFDLLGFMEWLDAEKGVDTLKPIAPVVEDRRHEYLIEVKKVITHNEYNTTTEGVFVEKHELTPEAATAVSDAIKALLAYIQGDELHPEHLYIAARKAVQQGGDV